MIINHCEGRCFEKQKTEKADESYDSSYDSEQRADF